MFFIFRKCTPIILTSKAFPLISSLWCSHSNSNDYFWTEEKNHEGSKQNRFLTTLYGYATAKTCYLTDSVQACMHHMGVKTNTVAVHCVAHVPLTWLCSNFINITCCALLLIKHLDTWIILRTRCPKIYTIYYRKKTNCHFPEHLCFPKAIWLIIQNWSWCRDKYYIHTLGGAFIN